MALVVADFVDDTRGGDFWFGAADDAGFDGAGFVEAGEDFGDAAVGDTELAGDVAGSEMEKKQKYDQKIDRNQKNGSQKALTYTPITYLTPPCAKSTICCLI